MAYATILTYLLRSDPDLLKRRMRGPGAEAATSQKVIQLAILVVFAGTLAVLWLDRRFVWSHVPLFVSLGADALVAAGFAILFFALRENTFAAVNIVVETGQKVISTGPYAIVRHPYYTGLLVLSFATPPALGSWWGLLPLVPMLPIIVWRIRYEERFLTEHLAGYAEYCRRVRWRLVPFVW